MGSQDLVVWALGMGRSGSEDVDARMSWVDEGGVKDARAWLKNELQELSRSPRYAVVIVRFVLDVFGVRAEQPMGIGQDTTSCHCIHFRVSSLNQYSAFSQPTHFRKRCGTL